MTAAGEFARETVDLIWVRDQGRCVDCGRPLDRERRGEAFGGWSVQHRWARGNGGEKLRGGRPARPWLTLASNGALMCGDGVKGCHGEAETRQRARATLHGYVVRAGVRRPSEVPMLHAVHGWVLLDDEGGYARVDGPDDEAVAGAA